MQGSWVSVLWFSKNENFEQKGDIQEKCVRIHLTFCEYTCKS